MKRILLPVLLGLLLSTGLSAQNGAVVYSLPQTVLTLKVKAQREAFTAGPYAAYAQKYLGVAARTQNATTTTLLEVTLVPYVEADPKARFAISIPEKSTAGFLQLCQLIAANLKQFVYISGFCSCHGWFSFISFSFFLTSF